MEQPKLEPISRVLSCHDMTKVALKGALQTSNSNVNLLRCQIQTVGLSVPPGPASEVEGSLPFVAVKLSQVVICDLSSSLPLISFLLGGRSVGRSVGRGGRRAVHVVPYTSPAQPICFLFNEQNNAHTKSADPPVQNGQGREREREGQLCPRL